MKNFLLLNEVICYKSGPHFIKLSPEKNFGYSSPEIFASGRVNAKIMLTRVFQI